MPRLVTAPDGTTWRAALAGRRTQYARDEVTLAFTLVPADDADTTREEVRFARFSPRGAKAPELAFEEASDAALARLLAAAQPEWTSPDGAYGRA
ncbi:MAG TPA: hypothetical protein VFN90_05815 [Gemmatimonadales bacterium]|nr:hypothetical protein [Gemmatimonadales bacterium]